MLSGQKNNIFLVFIVIVQLILLQPYFDVPLIRDEGIYGYMAETWLSGGALYRDAFDTKPPLIYLIYASAIKLGLPVRFAAAFFSILSTLLCYRIGRSLLGAEGGLLSAAFFAVFSGSIFIEGAFANTETFYLPFLLFALLLFFSGGRGGLFAAGFFSGLAVMLKFTVLLNFIPLIIWARKDKKLFLLSGFALAIFLVLAYLMAKGILVDFVNAAVIFNIKYFSLSDDLISRFESIPFLLKSGFSTLFVLAGAGAYFAARGDQKIRLFLAWSASSLAGVILFGYFFGHYAIQLVPPLAVLAAYGFIRWEKSLNLASLASITALLYLAGLGAVYHFPYYFTYSHEEISQKYYRHNLFNLSKKAGEALKECTKPGDSVYNCGGEGEINFISGRQSPSRYFYVLPSFKNEFLAKAEETAARDVLVKQPKFIVFTKSSYEFEKIRRICLEKYELVKSEEGAVYVYRKK